jgi:hypothetical protein
MVGLTNINQHFSFYRKTHIGKMGADGGINWIHVTGDKDEFYWLVRPLGFLWDSSSYYDEYHDDYIEKYDPVPKAKDGFYEVSTYGTSQEIQGLEDLRDVIQDLRWHMRPSSRPFDSVWGDTNPLDLTWLELLTEYHTADYWKTKQLWSLPSPMRVMFHRCNWFFDKDQGTFKEKYKNYDHPVYHITLREWLSRIREVADANSVGSVETWT